MQTTIKKVLTILEADNTLDTLLSATVSDPKIYPAITNDFENFPCIAYQVIDAQFRGVPRNTQDTTIQFDIYSKTSKQNVEDIYTRLNDLLNYYQDTDPLVVYIVQSMETDNNPTDRSLWHKVVRYQMVSKN